MAKLPALLLVLLTITAISLLACGGGSGASRQLLSVTVTPATANATDFLNGAVQFTATGTYDRAPSPAAVNPASRDLVPSNVYPADAISFSASGVAQRKAGFAGTVTVRGGDTGAPPTP